MKGTHFEIYRKTGIWRDTWRWRLRAANGEIIASGESYKDQRGCLNAIRLLKETDRHTPVETET